MPRRAALARLSLAGSALAAAGAGAWRLWRRPPPSSAVPALPLDEGPGPLLPATRDTVLDFAEAVIGLPVERAHYETFLTWRAEHLPGYRAMCQALALALDEAARTRGPRSFTAAEPAVRRALADQVSAARAPALDGVATLRRELLTLFSRTDAWVLAGYEGWPGVPRGLDAYRRPPRRRPGP